MANPLAAVTDEPEQLTVPATVVLPVNPDMRFSPNDIRLLKQQTGKTLTELTGEDADEADQMQTMAWLRLRRDGYQPDWHDCGDVTLEFQAEPPDPTKTEPSATSPPSADSGE